tara:strand:+ start:104 stop:268 length:165 start_codon:yes stop_codon:yes gene_type:complete
MNLINGDLSLLISERRPIKNIDEIIIFSIKSNEFKNKISNDRKRIPPDNGICFL